MRRTILGRTGLEVSVLGLGAGGDSRLGLPLGDAARSVRLVRTALELGVNFIDTAEAFAADPDHRTLDLALADDLWDVIMVGFNLLNQSARARVFPLTQANGVGTLIMVAVRRALSRPERLSDLLQDLAQRGKISRELAQEGLSFLVDGGAASSLPDAAYRFCRDEPGAHVVLSGTSDEDHLRANVRSLEAPPLPAAARERLIELFRDVDDVSGH